MDNPTKKSPEAGDKKEDNYYDNKVINETGDKGVQDSDITPEEAELLDNAGVREWPEDDDDQLAESELDQTDEDGEPLNEHDDLLMGEDLDVPGTEADDADEAIGEEDEENNSYSSSDQDDDTDK